MPRDQRLDASIMLPMRSCPECSAELADADRHCPECGAEFARTVPPTQTSPAPPDVPRRSVRPPKNDHGRFEPGAKLGNRYRIVGLLGRGGMGEVYRADDLELGQSVALKFLPAKVAADPLALARFRNEVRTARQIGHPNVCRMFDIGQADGHVFLSMEYIDGEDLAHVLRRMGRPSSEKALEIARQLCLGLAAAHENGVLHRDLKPANIMIDGRGRVRITDFGLAGLAGEFSDREELAGTPAYMAPEQLSSGSVSVRSDIYALGLVLHEIFTGRKVFETNNTVELKRLHETRTTSLSSTGTETIDSAVERVLHRCLEFDPQRRPSSVYAVLGALPGGDPLAAALAAGETPSPELLAEGGESGGLKPRLAVPLLAAGLIALGILVWLAPHKSLVGYVNMDTPKAELALRARDLVKEVTGDAPPRYEASGFSANLPFLEYLEKHDVSPDRWDKLKRSRPPAMTYWHRFSRTDLVPSRLHSDRVSRDNPLLAGPGSARVQFDPQGRLLELLMIPRRTLSPLPENPIDPVAFCFKHAGLERSQFEPAERRLAPPVPCDDVQAYSGPYGAESGEPVTVQVGSFEGRPNYFEIINSWDVPEQDDSAKTDGPPFAVVLLGITLLVVTILIARRNVAQNRCDRRGAFRLALFTLVAWMLSWTIGELRLRGSLDDFARAIGYLLFDKPLGHAFAHAVLTWLAYIAIEPYARRLWPRTLVTWTRLMLGRVRDPQLGRDLLVGALIGCGMVFLAHLTRFAHVWVGGAPPPPDNYVTVGGLWDTLSTLVALMGDAVGTPLMMLVLLVVLRLICRVNWAALAVFLLFGPVMSLLQKDASLDAETAITVVSSLITGVLILVALVRFGACAGLAAWWVEMSLNTSAVTPDLSQWYAAPALVPVLLSAGLVVFGFYTSLAGRSLFRDSLLNDR